MTTQTRYSLYVLLTAMLAAIGNILVEIILRFFQTTPFMVVLLSNLIGGAFLVGLVVWQRTPIRSGWRKFDWLRLVGAALAIYAFAFMVRFSAIGLIGSGKAILLGRVETIFVVVLAVIFLGEVWSVQHWTAGILTLGGAILINLNATAWQLQFGRGEFLAILAPFGLAIGIITLKPMLDRLDAQWITGLALLLGGLFLLPFWPRYGQAIGLQQAVFWLIALSGVLRGLSWSLYNLSMRHIGASRSAIIFLSSAFFTVLGQVVLDAIWPGLRLQVPDNLLMAVIGGVVMAIGIVILQGRRG